MTIGEKNNYRMLEARSVRRQPALRVDRCWSPHHWPPPTMTNACRYPFPPAFDHISQSLISFPFLNKIRQSYLQREAALESKAAPQPWRILIISVQI